MFRLDLYARLTDIQIHIPAIRERRQDILEILANLAVSEGLKLRVDADAAEALLLGAWPLNVCGLRQVVARITSRKSGVLDLATLRKIEPALATELKSRRNSPTRSSVKLPNAHKTLRERSSLEQLLAEHHGNVAKVAKDLGTTRAQIYRWMSRLGIDVDSLRGIG
jgi:two-component system NtrC family response regulator